MSLDIQSIVHLDKETIVEVVALAPPGGEAKFLSELTRLFNESTPEILLAIDGAIAAQDEKALLYHAHRLRGMCLTLGARCMGDLCETLESHSIQGQFPGSEPVAQKLKSIYTGCRDELESLIGQLQALA